MNNGQINKMFLDSTDYNTHKDVLAAIAKHYGITADAALSEVTDPEAEHLLDYLTGETRTAVSLLMKRRGL